MLSFSMHIISFAWLLFIKHSNSKCTNSFDSGLKATTKLNAKYF